MSEAKYIKLNDENKTRIDTYMILTSHYSNTRGSNPAYYINLRFRGGDSLIQLRYTDYETYIKDCNRLDSVLDYYTIISM